MESIKTILFCTALGAGSICLTCIFVAVAIRCLCIMLDHLKAGNVLRKALILYIKTIRPDLKIKESDIDLSKRRIKTR